MNRIAIQPHLYTSPTNPRGTAYITNEDNRRQLTISAKEVYASLSKAQKHQLDTTSEKTIIFVDPYERQFKFSLKECGTWAVSLFNHSMAVRGLH